MILYDENMCPEWEAVGDYGELTAPEKDIIDLIHTHAHMDKSESFKVLFESGRDRGRGVTEARDRARGISGIIRHVRERIATGKPFHMVMSMDLEDLTFHEGFAKRDGLRSRLKHSDPMGSLLNMVDLEG